MKIIIQIISLLAISIVVVSCHQNNPQKDVEKFVISAREKLGMINEVFEESRVNKIPPNLNSVGQAQENAGDDVNFFSLDSFHDFKLVGVLFSKMKKQALLETASGEISCFNVHDSIGKEKAAITDINLAGITIKYKISNQWQTDKINFPQKILTSFPQKDTPLGNNLLSVEVDNVPVGILLNWLCQFHSVNAVISSDIEGVMHLRLSNVSYEQILEAVLKSQGLGEKKLDGITYISSLNDIAAYEKEIQEIENKAMPQMSLLRLNYANANDIAKLLQDKQDGFLSKQGKIAVDRRTNSLLMSDTAERINKITTYVKQLDIPVSQILIEARIVNIDDDYEKELGIKFGLSNGHHISGTLKGANERAGGQSFANINPADRLNVDLPAINSSAGTIGVALFKLSTSTLVDLELSALESEGHAEILSNPKLVTTNQEMATIQAGEEIPYQEAAFAEGATKTSFKKAVLSLQVTPQIAPNHKIVLRLKVNQDKRSSQEVKGVPAIDTREIMTQVLVNDGQTIVLGGIYERTKLNGVERIPFLSNLPIIGVLFRHKKEVDNRRELLIFVTPKIIG